MFKLGTNLVGADAQIGESEDQPYGGETSGIPLAGGDVDQLMQIFEHRLMFDSHIGIAAIFTHLGEIQTFNLTGGYQQDRFARGLGKTFTCHNYSLSCALSRHRKTPRGRESSEAPFIY